MVSTPKPWWQGKELDFPAGWWADRNGVEKLRFEVPLSDGDVDLEYELIDRLRRAATLLEIGATQTDMQNATRWQLIGLIHEAIGLIDTRLKRTSWLLSCLAWQIGKSPAIAGQLADQLFRVESLGPDEVFERLVVRFSTRDFGGLRTDAKAAISSGQRLRDAAIETGDIITALTAGSLLACGQACLALVDYVWFESDSIPNSASLDDFITFSTQLGHSFRSRAGLLFREAFTSFVEASSRFNIESLDNLQSETKATLRSYLSAYPELWETQQDAIRKGLLSAERKNVVIAVPTSSGKTLCGELAIVQELTDDPNTNCFYVVPTRALVEEKGVELKRKLRGFLNNGRVVSATSSLQADDIEADLLGDARIVVCTPEKLDLLIRHDDAVLQRASLFIIDEGHMINDATRGLGLEFMVIKLMLLKPGARILMLSAMVPNSEDFGRWLNSEAVSSDSWRPTRQKFGELNFVPLHPRGSNLEVRLYGDADHLQDTQFIVCTYSKKPRTRAEKVVWASNQLRKRGPVLVFCMSKPRCEKIASEIVDYLKTSVAVGVDEPLLRSVDERVERLRQKISREVSPDFLLSQALAFGIAYHHADLPPRIRVDLEHLIADSLVEIVISTTTLAEGVNLPISTVIYEDWQTNPDRRFGNKPSPLDLSKFRNIAGRAGRAGKEAEGLILFLEPDQKRVDLNGTTEHPRDYFLRQQYPSIRSRFLEIVDRYDPPSEGLLQSLWKTGDQRYVSDLRQSLRQFGLSVLHALEVLGDSQDGELSKRVVEKSLLFVQQPESGEKARRWFQSWVNFYTAVSIDREELRPLAMQVGLPLRAIQRLYSKVAAEDVVAAFAANTDSAPLILSEHQVSVVSSLITSIEELDFSPTTAPHGLLLSRWMTGARIADLVSLYEPYLERSGPDKPPSRPVEKTCNYVTQQLSNSSSWGAYAVTRILELINPENLATISHRLALFAYYGVNTVPAVYLCLLGMERIDSIRIGDAFLKDEVGSPSIPAIRLWAETKTPIELENILRGNDDRIVDRLALTLLVSA